MEENQLKIKIYSKKLNAVVSRVIDIINGKPVMYNKPIPCTNCDDDAVLVYDGEKVYCPKCGNESIVVYSYNDWLKDEEETHRLAMESICLNKYGCVDGLNYYKLSTRLDYETWLEVKQYFQYFTSADKVYSDDGRLLLGWVTLYPEKVEDVLEIPLERTLHYRNEKMEEKLKKQREEKKELENLVNKCKEPFINIDVPAGDFTLNGVKVENPLYPHNIYGGGEWWVICEEDIWFVKNNGADGADWSKNNIQTSGAGAIGRKINYNNELYGDLMKLKKYK